MAVEPGYTPETVNTGGWSGTQLAWLALFFAGCERVWHVYYSETRNDRSFSTEIKTFTFSS